MLKKIPTSQVTLGMFVDSVEGSWLSHSLWKTRFLIQDRETLARVKGCGAREIWIDIGQGRDLPPPPEPPIELQSQPANAVAGEPEATEMDVVAILEPPPEALPKPQERRSMGEELQTASDVLRRSKEKVTSLFAEARMGNAVNTNECAPLVNDIVESIDRNSDALISLCRLKTADEYTYLHSVSVCALMVSLGRQLGLDDATCRDAGMAGLLHDLGKAVVPLEIINKPGKLTDEEFKIIKSHPEHGYHMLVASGVENRHVLDVARHHHERIDGKGYPDGLTGDNISLIARMSAVCDVYDAITSNRPYKNGWDPAESVARMASWQGHFDSTVLQNFIKTIGIYPIGALVRMASGKLGVVVEQNPARLTAPKIKVFFSTNSGMPIEPRLVDLAERGVTDKIVARESPENWNFGYLNELWARHVS